MLLITLSILSVIAWTLICWSFSAIMSYLLITGVPIPNYLPSKPCCDIVQISLYYINIISLIGIILIGPFQLAYDWFNKIFRLCLIFLYMTLIFITSVSNIVFMVVIIPSGVNNVIPFTIYYFSLLISLVFISNLLWKGAINYSWLFRFYIIGTAPVSYYLMYFILYRFVKFNSHNALEYAFNWLFFLIPVILAEVVLYLYHNCYMDEEQFLITTEEGII